MLPATFVVLATSFIAALAVPLQERAVTDIINDIEVFTTELNGLESDLNGLATAGANGLTNLDLHANRFIAGLQKATADSTATGPVSEADGQTIAENVRPAGEELIDVLGLYVTNKAVFVNLAKTVPNLIENTEEALEDIATNVQLFVSEVVANGPADIVAADAPLRSSIAASLATAIATFQS